MGIGVVASQERSVFSSTEFWFWFDDPQFTPTSSPESASVRIDPTERMSESDQSVWRRIGNATLSPTDIESNSAAF